MTQHHNKPSTVRTAWESFSPEVSPNSTISYTLLAIISKSKGKNKMTYDDDDVPLAHLKKQRLSSTNYSSPLFDIEVVAISLTNLQHATPIKGLVYDFLNTPLLGTPVWPSDMKFPAAPCIPDHQNLHLQQHLQSNSSIQSRHSSPSPMKLQQPSPTPAHAHDLPSDYVADLPSPPPVAATKISPSRKFIRANRGRRNNSSTAVGSTAGYIINQEERRVRPPPNA
jgi:hypothetical protein